MWRRTVPVAATAADIPASVTWRLEYACSRAATVSADSGRGAGLRTGRRLRQPPQGDRRQAGVESLLDILRDGTCWVETTYSRSTVIRTAIIIDRAHSSGRWRFTARVTASVPLALSGWLFQHIVCFLPTRADTDKLVLLVRGAPAAI